MWRRYLVAAFIGATVYDWLLMYLRFRRDRARARAAGRYIGAVIGGR
jgi:hypothetical protein